MIKKDYLCAANIDSMINRKEFKKWSDEDWALNGYVCITVHDVSGDDAIYVKRHFSSPVITQNEWSKLFTIARNRHRENVKRRAREINERTSRNRAAMRPYNEYAERMRAEQRKKDVAEGRIPFDERTFFDLL